MFYKKDFDILFFGENYVLKKNLLYNLDIGNTFFIYKIFLCQLMLKKQANKVSVTDLKSFYSRLHFCAVFEICFPFFSTLYSFKQICIFKFIKMKTFLSLFMQIFGTIILRLNYLFQAITTGLVAFDKCSGLNILKVYFSVIKTNSHIIKYVMLTLISILTFSGEVIMFL